MNSIQKNYLMVTGALLPGVATAFAASLLMKGAGKTVLIAAFAIGAVAGGWYTAKILK